MRHGYLSRPMIALLLFVAWPALSAAQETTEPVPESPAPQKVVVGQLEEATPLEPRDDAKKRGDFWERLRLGATVSYMSPPGKIRSKSSNTAIFRNINIDPSAIRYEPRVGSDGRISMSPIVGDTPLNYRVTNDFIRDPRQDSGSTLDNTIEETAWLDLNAAYDLKTWRHGTLLLQLDAGYYSGDLGPIEVAVDIPEESILNPLDQDLTADDPFANYQYIYPSAGTLNEIPVSLSAIWQFRPRSPFRPYFGLGLGYLNVDLKDSGSLETVNRQLAGIAYTWTVRGSLVESGNLPAETITAEATSDYMWLAHGGLEYNVNRKWSLYLSAKFNGTTANVRMKALGYYELGSGVNRNEQIDDVTGITGEQSFIERILSLPVDEAVILVADVAEQSSNPADNERSYYTTFPVYIGTPVTIEIPNPTDPNGNTQVERQGKFFVQGGEIGLDFFSIGAGFRYRY